MTAGETTVTLHTPPGRGGIAVILLSGPKTVEILDAVFRPLPSHRRGGEGVLQLGRLVADGETIDEAIVYRRDGLAEINIHGGPAVARRAMELLVACGAAAAPAPAAGTESFPTAHPRWSNPAIGREMLDALPLAHSALVVAAVTHQWSAGISELVRTSLAKDAPRSDDAARKLRLAARGLASMRRLLHPVEVVIAGPPNVGKSTLANVLIARQVSIVHESAGTTRDWVRELALLGGVPIRLTDTAGLWNPPEGIDAEAVRRARRRTEQADLVLLLGAGRPIERPDWLHAGKLLRICAKCDVCPPIGPADAEVSAHTGEGLEALKKAILAALELDGFETAAPRAFTQRQADLLNRAADAMENADLREARDALKELLG